MIARHQYDGRALTGPLAYFLHHGVLLACSTDPALQRPEVAEVTRQVDRRGGIFAHKRESLIGLAGTGAEVDVGPENRATGRHSGVRRLAADKQVVGYLQTRQVRNRP